MLCISAAYAVVRCPSVCLCVCVCVCLSVCPSVTFVDSVKINKHIFKISLQSSFSTPNITAIFWRGPPNGASNAGGVGKGECRWGSQYMASSRAVNAATGWCYQHGAAGKLWHLSLVTTVKFVNGGRRRNVYDKKPQRYAKDNRAAFNCTQW